MSTKILATDFPFIFSDLVNSQCHPLVEQAVCGLLQPPCIQSEHSTGAPVPPCSEFCEQVALRCGDFLNCSSLPVDTAGGTCIPHPGKFESQLVMKLMAVDRKKTLKCFPQLLIG